jgi:riboflavin kinase/FMN adenylyltransferase
VLTVQNTEHFRIESPSIVTIGTFDGVHIGHQKILARLRQLGQQTGFKTVVFTFDPHPRKVLFPGQSDLRLINSTSEKLDLLEHYGVDVTVVYPFNKNFAELSSEEYIHGMLVKQLNVKHLVIGYDHRFGKDRKGDINTLRQYADRLLFEVEEISVQDIDNISVSSSKIRKALEEGNIELASEFLGHNFTLSARVVKGKQLGRTLGYATANLQVNDADKLIPKTGVYFVSAMVEGRNHFGMMSIGTNPTTDSDGIVKMEVHIFGFNQDIYAQTIKVNFLKRLRDEKKFDSLDELKTALNNDKANCLQLIQEL